MPVCAAHLGRQCLVGLHTVAEADDSYTHSPAWAGCQARTRGQPPEQHQSHQLKQLHMELHACWLSRTVTHQTQNADTPVSCAAGGKVSQQEARAASSAASEAAAQAAQMVPPSTTFYTKRVADPNLVPLLLSKGVQFGAVRVRPLPLCARVLLTACSWRKEQCACLRASAGRCRQNAGKRQTQLCCLAGDPERGSCEDAGHSDRAMAPAGADLPHHAPHAGLTFQHQVRVPHWLSLGPAAATG